MYEWTRGVCLLKYNNVSSQTPNSLFNAYIAMFGKFKSINIDILTYYIHTHAYSHNRETQYLLQAPGDVFALV